MTLKLAKPTTAKLAFRKTWQPMDAHAAAYITAVETADGQALEEKTKIAIDNFVLGCKADGIWGAIKASCILAGARTLSGALVPLVGAAPTNNNFVSGDYNRKTGLAGDGNNKYLNTNRNNDADPQNSKHLSVFASTLNAPGTFYLGTTDLVAGASILIRRVTFGHGAKVNTATIGAATNTATGFFGASRSQSTTMLLRSGGINDSISVSSETPYSGNYTLLSSGGSASFGSGRISFYSIGESLDLAKLDARVTDLINAFGAAIP